MAGGEVSPAPMANHDRPPRYNASGSRSPAEGSGGRAQRPGMYIGSTGERGLHHHLVTTRPWTTPLIETLAGYCSRIEVKILKVNIIQVTDSSRGIPVDIQADTGLPAVTVVLYHPPRRR